QVLRRVAHAAHPPRRPHAGVDARGERRGADRARRAVEHRAWGGAAAAEAVALDHALDALALARADHVDVLAGVEDRGLDLVADLQILVALAELELGRPARWRHARLLEVPLHRLRRVARRLRLDQAHLHGLVAARVPGPGLDAQAGGDLEHGDRHHRAVIAEHLGHAQLLAQ